MSQKALKCIVNIIIITIVIGAIWFYFTTDKSNLNFQTWVSLIATFFTAILTALYVRTTSEQIDTANKQLEEMKQERATKEQPLNIIEKERFEVEKPRFFYSPPEDEYSFQSRYSYFAEIFNCSQYPAINVDFDAEIHAIDSEKKYKLKTITRRIDIIPPNGRRKVELFFSGDDITRLFDALSEPVAERLPTIKAKVSYQSLSGGYFKMNKESLLVPRREKEYILKNWQSKICSAYIEEREAINYLRNEKIKDKWNLTFNNVKDRFDKTLENYEAVDIKVLDCLNKFSLKTISKEEFEKEREGHVFASFIHKCKNCDEYCKEKERVLLHE